MPARSSAGVERLQPVISPDGRKIADADAEGLWLRRLDQVGPSLRLVAGTMVSRPFWSPQSTEVGFFDAGRLLRIGVEGGRPLPLAEVTRFGDGGGGGAWLEEGRIVVASGGAGLSAVPAGGGPLAPVWEVPAAGDIQDLHQPGRLPGGAGVLVVVHRRGVSGSGIDTIAVWKPSGEHRILFQQPGEQISHPVHSPSGHVLFQYRLNPPEIWAFPFSLERLERTGEAFRVTDQGQMPSVSADGSLIYLLMDADVFGPRQLVWVDRTGRKLDAVGPVLPGLISPSLSHDERRVAVVAGRSVPDIHLWLIEVANGVALPLTRESGPNFGHVWRTDDRAFFHTQWSADPPLTFLAPTDGVGEKELLFQSAATAAPSGKKFILWPAGAGEAPDTGWTYVEAGRTNRNPLPLGKIFQGVGHLAFSPDEDWLLLTSSISRLKEVWATDFPALSTRVMISRQGARSPIWHPRGEAVYFLTPDWKSLMSARRRADGPGFAEPQKVFDVPEDIFLMDMTEPLYDVTADGERFLMIQRVKEPDSTNAPARPKVVLVENWAGEFRRKK